MTARSPLLLILIALSLLAGFAGAAAAHEDSPDAASETAAENDAAAETRQTQTVNGATITWNLEHKRFEAPTAEQQAILAEAMRKMLLEKSAAGKLPLAEKATVETLPNGMKRVRVTPGMLNFSMVRVAPGGELVSTCVDNAEAAAETLAGASEKDGEAN